MAKVSQPYARCINASQDEYIKGMAIGPPVLVHDSVPEVAVSREAKSADLTS